MQPFSSRLPQPWRVSRQLPSTVHTILHRFFFGVCFTHRPCSLGFVARVNLFFFFFFYLFVTYNLEAEGHLYSLYLYTHTHLPRLPLFSFKPFISLSFLCVCVWCCPPFSLFYSRAVVILHHQRQQRHIALLICCVRACICYSTRVSVVSLSPPLSLSFFIQRLSSGLRAWVLFFKQPAKTSIALGP